MAKSNFPLMFQPLARYADFNGRSRRSEYWLWVLFVILCNVVLSVVQFTMLGASFASMHSSGSHAAAAGAMGSMMLINLLKAVMFFAFLIPNIAVGVRRMHDINRTGWWILFPTAVMIVATIAVLTLTGADLFSAISKASQNTNTNDPAAAFAIMGAVFRTLAWIILPTFLAKIVTLVFRVTEGTRGPNRFGPDPKGSVPNVF